MSTHDTGVPGLATAEPRAHWQTTMPPLPGRSGRPLPDAADVVVVGGGYLFDRLPHVGRFGGVTCAMGHCRTGVMLSTYLGTRVGEWLGGGPMPLLARVGFPLVPAPYEGRPWLLPLAGEWYRLCDRLERRSPRPPGRGPEPAP